VSEASCESSLDVAVGNAEDGVTWLHSYITTDARRMFCGSDASGPEAIRRVGEHDWLPIDRISEVRMLDPSPRR
jgi:Protein of unknown function (DUF4242)